MSEWNASGVITITTDFGHKGPFAAVMQGVIIKRFAAARTIAFVTGDTLALVIVLGVDASRVGVTLMRTVAALVAHRPSPTRCCSLGRQPQRHLRPRYRRRMPTITAPVR